MALKEKETVKLREKIEALDLSDPDDLATYEKERFEYIKTGEGAESESYTDTEGNRTVGVGFNMDRGQSARDEWNEAFEDLPADKRPDFDKVYNGKKPLDDTEIELLTNHSIEIREEELERIYGDNLNEVDPNVRLAIEDAYYNTPELVKDGTKFKESIEKHIEARKRSDTESANKHLDNATWEIRKRSNPRFDDEGNPIPENRRRGIQNRRNSESQMMNSDGRHEGLDKIPTPGYIKKPVEDEAKEKLEESKDKRPSEEEIRQSAEEMARENEVILTDQIEETCGITPAFHDGEKVSGMVSSLVADYEQYSGDIFADIRRRVAEAIEKAASKGKTEEDLRQAAQHVMNQLPGRFERMSEGIILNFNANLNASRQTDFGITHYIWRTSDDESVRHSHAHRDDQLFAWGGDGIKPGEEINCRCRAEPTCPDEKVAA